MAYLSLRVYLVEDSEVLRERFERHLAAIDGIDVVGHSPTAEHALEAIARLQPDLILLDLALAAGSGIDVLRSARRSGSNAWIFVVSSLLDPMMTDHCLRLGADRCYNKATDLATLFDDIATLPRERPAIQDGRKDPRDE